MNCYLVDMDFYSGLICKLLRDLVKLSVHSSCALLDGCGMTSLYEAVLQEKVCMSSLLEPSGDPIVGKQLPPTLHVQPDNCTKDKKCRYVFCFKVVARRKRNLQRGVRVFLDDEAYVR